MTSEAIRFLLELIFFLEESAFLEDERIAIRVLLEDLSMKEPMSELMRCSHRLIVVLILLIYEDSLRAIIQYPCDILYLFREGELMKGDSLSLENFRDIDWRSDNIIIPQQIFCD